MTIAIGESIPVVTLKRLTPKGLEDINTGAFFDESKVVLFGLPGAFTPVCSASHLPGYVALLPAFNAKGIKVACLSVNDAYVMDAWATSIHAEGVTMLADGNAAFTKALGLDVDETALGYGIRCKRSALYAENGIVKLIVVEKPGVFEKTSASAMLEAITGVKAAPDESGSCGCACSCSR